MSEHFLETRLRVGLLHGEWNSLAPGSSFCFRLCILLLLLFFGFQFSPFSFLAHIYHHLTHW